MQKWDCHHSKSMPIHWYSYNDGELSPVRTHAIVRLINLALSIFFCSSANDLLNLITNETSLIFRGFINISGIMGREEKPKCQTLIYVLHMGRLKFFFWYCNDRLDFAYINQ